MPGPIETPELAEPDPAAAGGAADDSAPRPAPTDAGLSPWELRLREATARLEAVGLPEPPNPPHPVRSERVIAREITTALTPVQPPWSPTFWSRQTQEDRDAAIRVQLTELLATAVRGGSVSPDSVPAREQRISEFTTAPRPRRRRATGTPSVRTGRGAPEPARAVTLPGRGDLVLAAGVGVTGLPVVRYLAGTGASVVVTSNRPPPTELASIPGDVVFAGDLQAPPDGTTLIVTSAGIPPTNPLLATAIAAGVEVIGEVELAWRLDQASGLPRPWLVVTGTNGKTTTTGMLESILRAAQHRVTACGNIGWPVIEAVLAGGDGSEPNQPRQSLIAVELSSFQLHWAPSLRPDAGVVLNVAEDHLDWHGSMAAYAAAKARALTGRVALGVIDDPGAAALLSAAPARLAVPILSGRPFPGALGVRHAMLVDNAFGQDVLLAVDQVRPGGEHNVTNALAAAGLALATGVGAAAVADGLRAFEPGGHRNVLVAERAGVQFFDDSKATNPHAALASLSAFERVVWIAGGQLKGASVDDLVSRVGDRLVGVVLLGVDAPILRAALSRHAPDVPVLHVPGKDDGVMRTVVSAAASMAAPGDVVLLAPAAASLDMYSSYAARGNAFAAAAKALPGGAAGADQ